MTSLESHLDIELFDDSYIQDPYPLYDRMRASGPVHQVGESGFYAVCTWDAINDAVTRPEDFSSNLTATMMPEPGESIARVGPNIGGNAVEGAHVGGRLSGRVVFITGAARGQGRAHAVRLANDGADIIAVDLAGPLPPSVPYDSATPEDLAETVRLVEKTGRRILATTADTRDLGALTAAVDKGVAEFGRLDVIVANAGIAAPQAWNEITPESFRDVMDINVTGTWNAVMAGAQKIIDGGRGGSIILVSSAAGIKMQPFMIHYTASKHAVTGMARGFAAELGQYNPLQQPAPWFRQHPDGHR